MVTDSDGPAVGQGIGRPTLGVDVAPLKVRSGRDGRNLDDTTAKHEIRLRGRTNRRIRLENLLVHLVHRVEVTHIGKINVCGYDILVVHASRFKYGSDIFESLSRLCFYSSSDDSTAGIGSHCSRDMKQIAGFHAGAEGDTGNLRSLRGNDLFRLRTCNDTTRSHRDNNNVSE